MEKIDTDTNHELEKIGSAFQYIQTVKYEKGKLVDRGRTSKRHVISVIL